MPRKTSFCNAALLRSDIKRYWPLLFLYVAVWVVILPMQILSVSRECDGVAEGPFVKSKCTKKQKYFL